ncbi:hypothetical protein V5O48_014338 [Marasmius crinis-equi]|uniref:Uncharacterized protein n=1 Tax=Marasmius crinis-equi TaxID=585013 RepID=A0ABR3EXL9_9AGAR
MAVLLPKDLLTRRLCSTVYKISPLMLHSLIDFVNDGLPIIISVGGLPNGIPGFDADGTQVAKVNAEDDVLGVLSSLGVTPAATVQPCYSTLYTIRRDVESTPGLTSHFYLYNQGNANINFTLTLAATGTPFILDAWNGEVSPVAVLNTTEDGHIVIPGVSLAANQSTSFTVTSEDVFEGVLAPSIYASGADSDVITTATSSGIEVRSITKGTRQITLSNEETQTLKTSFEGEAPRDLTGRQSNTRHGHHQRI